MAGEIDIATLGIKVDASTADDAASKLDTLTNASVRAETATQSATSASATFKAAISAAIGAINSNTVAMGNLTDKMNTYRPAAGGAGGATDTFENRLAKLRATIDPMGVAIDKVNDELIEARILFEAGAMSAEDYARAQVVLNARSADFARRQGQMNSAMAMGARSARLQAHETLNLSRQFADIAVTGAMGMNPLMILVQQGPQIADVLSTARARGISTASAFRQMGESITPFLSKIARVGVVAGVAFTAVGLFIRDASKDLQDVQAEFGFTEKQMERLKDEGTDLGFTLGDAFKGIGSAITGVITDHFGEELRTVESWWNTFLDYLTVALTATAKGLLGIFVGTFYAIRSTWAMLPGAMADISIQAANYVIEAVNSMVKGSVSAINGLIDMLPDWLRPEGRIGTPKGFEQFANPFAGQASKTADVAGSEFMRGVRRAGSAVDSFGRRVSEGMEASREARIREDAGDPEKEKAAKKPRKSEEERDWERAVKGAENYLKALREETELMGKNRVEAKQLATERAMGEIEAAAKIIGTNEAMKKAHNLMLQMSQAQYEWEQAVRSTALRDLRRDLTDLAEAEEFETSLIGLNNEAREKAMAQREIDIKLRALERDGIHLTAEEIEQETQRILRNAAARGRMTDAVEGADRAAVAARDMAQSVREATDSFGDLFGTVGEGYSNVMVTIFDFMAQQEEAQSRLIKLQADYNQGNIDAAEYAFEQNRIQNEMAQNQIANYGNMLGAAKTFFKEGSTGWKILEGAERIYRLFQFAMAIKAMFFDKAQTASSVANSGARAAADGVAAVAKAIASLPFPLNIAAGAATLAFLVAIGVKMFGKGGGGSAKSAASAAESAAKGQDIYSGPRDEYGAPTSGYSVLRPGQTTVAGVANDNYGTMATRAGLGGSIDASVHVTVQGNMVEDTMQQLEPILAAHQRTTVNVARQAVAADQAARSQRQTIGGGAG
jgi:hypothetical protein